MEEMVEMAARVPGCSGLEVVYPQNFEDAGALKILLDKYKLETAAVNLNIKGDEIWRYGTFSCPDKYVRDAAIQKMTKNMSADEKKALAKELKELIGTANYKAVADMNSIDKLYDAYVKE
jgi:hypothetical protein